RRRSAPKPNLAGIRRFFPSERRDYRQPAPGALLEERFGGSGGVTAGLNSRGGSHPALSGTAGPIRNESSGVRCFPGLHEAARRQGGPTRRFASVLPEDCVL